ncbi:hypothetical protein TRVL_07771 [Trypanosoma vivax]|nr:hypothetical protein TRVL_07771 [Trypanosoma vivax]
MNALPCRKDKRTTKRFDIGSAQTSQRQVRTSAIQTCLHGQASPTANDDSGGMRRGGGRMCLMHKSSVRHADNLLVLLGKRQKRHDITHRFVVLVTSSPYRSRKQRQLCAGSRDTMQLASKFFSRNGRISSHATTTRKQSSLCLGVHSPSAARACRAAVKVKHHNTLSHDKHGARRGPQLVEWR